LVPGHHRLKVPDRLAALSEDAVVEEHDFALRRYQDGGISLPTSIQSI
jgi:hypothetical protein